MSIENDDGCEETLVLDDADHYLVVRAMRAWGQARLSGVDLGEPPIDPDLAEDFFRRHPDLRDAA